MIRFAVFIFLFARSIYSFSQSIPELDSLLQTPDLYIVTYPDDGPKEVLKGLKPLFCNDKSVITKFVHAMELSPDTNCTGNAYYNYIIQFRSDSVGLNKWIGLSFDKNRFTKHSTMNDGRDNYYSFNPASISYLTSQSTVISERVYTLLSVQQSRAFNTYLSHTPETYFFASLRNDSAYMNYEGAVLLQFEFSEALNYEEGETFIKNKISEITASSDYYYQLREANWYKPGFQTQKIVLYINKQNLLNSAEAYAIDTWKRHGAITFTVYSTQIKMIESYYLSLLKK